MIFNRGTSDLQEAARKGTLKRVSYFQATDQRGRLNALGQVYLPNGTLQLLTAAYVPELEVKEDVKGSFLEGLYNPNAVNPSILGVCNPRLLGTYLHVVYWTMQDVGLPTGDRADLKDVAEMSLCLQDIQ